MKAEDQSKKILWALYEAARIGKEIKTERKIIENGLILYAKSQLKVNEAHYADMLCQCEISYQKQIRELQSQLKKRDYENRQVKRLLKNALEYYHNDKFANRAKSMKSFIDDALDILKTK